VSSTWSILSCHGICVREFGPSPLVFHGVFVFLTESSKNLFSFVVPSALGGKKPLRALEQVLAMRLQAKALANRLMQACGLRAAHVTKRAPPTGNKA